MADTPQQLPLADRFWLTVKQAAQHAGLGESTIRQYTYRSDFYPLRKMGRAVRIHRADFERWLDEHGRQDDVAERVGRGLRLTG